jgi:hypothetical protein
MSLCGVLAATHSVSTLSESTLEEHIRRIAEKKSHSHTLPFDCVPQGHAHHHIGFERDSFPGATDVKIVKSHKVRSAQSFVIAGFAVEKFLCGSPEHS